jgi:hypothetical protein
MSSSISSSAIPAADASLLSSPESEVLQVAGEVDILSMLLTGVTSGDVSHEPLQGVRDGLLILGNGPNPFVAWMLHMAKTSIMAADMLLATFGLLPA